MPHSIARVVDAWQDAWNAHDMRAAARLVAADVDFVTVAGVWLQGREEFRRHHEDIHRRHMRATTWRTLDFDVRHLADAIAIAHLEWTISGELEADGTERAPRAGIFTWVLTARDGVWVIAAAHNTNLRADVAHRLRGATDAGSASARRSP